MNNVIRVHAYHELRKIYDEFTFKLTLTGWNGKMYGFTETCRGEANGSKYTTFSLDNGFNMMLTNPAADSEEEPCLTYWFDDNDVTEVDSLEQLHMAFKLSE